ncbi:MAG: alpha/beta hydrolase, partial [Povalibacter sp.]
FGGYVTAQVISSEPRLAAIVLEATPPSLDAYMDHAHNKWGPLSSWSARAALRRVGVPEKDIVPIESIASVAPRPILFIGGGADSIVPEDMVNKLYAAAREPKEIWIVPGAVHGGYAGIAGEQYSGRLVRFYSEHLLR